MLLPLALVGFFTNYDTGLLTLATPDIAAGLGVSVAVFGVGVAISGSPPSGDRHPAARRPLGPAHDVAHQRRRFTAAAGLTAAAA